jgi:hypothetical protein
MEWRDVFTRAICIHQLYIIGDDGRGSVMRWQIFLVEKKGTSQRLSFVCQELLPRILFAGLHSDDQDKKAQWMRCGKGGREGEV